MGLYRRKEKHKKNTGIYIVFNVQSECKNTDHDADKEMADQCRGLTHTFVASKTGGNVR